MTLTVRPGTVHALLGENGAGKSTLVKCIVGYYRPDDGAVLVDDREQDIDSPTVARDLGIGMVYQHFTVVPGMTVAENLLLARGHLPLAIDWKKAQAELAEFMADRAVRAAAGRDAGGPVGRREAEARDPQAAVPASRGC